MSLGWRTCWSAVPERAPVATFERQSPEGRFRHRSFSRHRDVHFSFLSCPFRTSRAPSPVITLHLLGSTELSGVGSAESTAILTQSKYLATLAYLVLGRPAGYHRRDRLVGLLWPELDQQHARAALRKSVHVLRRSLGEEVVLSRGDEELTLAAGAVWCDAVAFGEAFEAGQYARSLDLYRRGDLLPGFFLPHAGDFEDWLARERSDLRDKAAAAAWGLAALHEANAAYTVSARYARQAAELAPSDERMLRRVLLHLDRLGDRAGAMSVYRDFARRLERDTGAAPSEETRALLERLRAG